MSQAGSTKTSGGGNVTFPITVPEGGTSVTSFPAHTVLLGEGSSAIGYVGPGAANTILMGSGSSSDPVFGMLIAVANITLTNGPGTITISSSGGSGTNITFNDDNSTSATTNASMINLFGTLAQGITVLGDGSHTITVSAKTASLSQQGTIVLASSAQAIAGTDSSNAVTSAALKAKLGTQTAHGVILGEGTTSALGITAAGATNTVLLGQGASADPIFGAVPNGALAYSTITLSNGNNITVTGSPISLGGTASIAVTGTTTNAVQIGNSSGSLTSIGVGTNGQVLLGSTGNAPAFGTITSPDGSIIFGTGSNSLTLKVNGAAFGQTITGNTGGALSPSAGNWNIYGNATQGVSTSGTASTLTITVASATTSQIGVVELSTSAEAIAGTNSTTALTPAAMNAKLGTQTQYGVMIGEGSSSALQATAAGTNGQVLIGATGANPAFGTIASAGGTITITGGSNTLNLDVSSKVIETLSDDVATVVTPSGNNIQLVGHVVEQGSTKFSTVVAGTHLININPMSPARWIVDPLGFNGTHTTISSAISSATAGDTIFIMPGSYTENPTLKAGVNLTAFGSDSSVPNDGSNGNVQIIGTLTFTGSGTVELFGIQLVTNSAYVLVVSGSNSSIVGLNNCSIICSNSTGINMSSTGGSQIRMYYCSGNIETTGISLFSCSTGTVQMYYCEFDNTGLSTTASTFSGTSNIYLTYCFLKNQFALSTSQGMSWYYSVIYTQNLNVSSLVMTNTVLLVTNHCELTGGSAPAATVASGCNLTIASGKVSSSNTNAISGAGILKYGQVVFDDTSSNLQSTLTQNVQSIGPRLQFGGASAGCQILCGSGTPNGNITAPINSLYLRSDGSSTTTRLYVNTNGATAWSYFLSSS